MTPAQEVAALPPSALRDAVLSVLADGDPFDRTRRPAHVTASAVVLDEDATRVLLVRHRRLGLWLHPGGHVEPDDGGLAAAARREVVEETGVVDVRVGRPLDLHRHPAPCASPGEAEHLDVRFAAVAPRDAVPAVSPESTDVRWFDLADLPEDAVPELAELVDAAVARHTAATAG